MQLIEAYLETA